MRLITWNCYRGECRARAADLSDLAPDLLVLQECAAPASGEDEQLLWFGPNPRHGAAIIASADCRLHRVPVHPGGGDSVYPAILEHRASGESLFVLGVWTKPAPTYVAALLSGLDAYADHLSAGPAVVLGDFNSHSRFDRAGQPTHGELVTRLREEFGLESAYHAFAPDREEVATHFWRWQGTQGFHLDYCFVPVTWRSAIREVRVIDEPAGSRRSDHRAVVVDVEWPVGSLRKS